MAASDPNFAADSLFGQRIHFVGVGGCGMSGLARMARQRGARVTGSDRGDSPTIQSLMMAGVAVVTQQTAASLPTDAQIVVKSAAIPDDHPEIAEAKKRGLEIVKYAQMLGRVMGEPSVAGVAVAGTHGKSTTTSILCHTLLTCGLDPSFIVGAHCEQIGGGSRVSQKVSEATKQRRRVVDSDNGGSVPEPPQGFQEFLVAEACEFDRSFHHFWPKFAVILNVEADHLDMYGSLDEIVASFETFARQVSDRLLIHHESPHRFAITSRVDAKVETIGFDPQADWRVEAMQAGGWKRTDGTIADRRGVKLSHRGKLVATWLSPMPGQHMDYNAAAAAVLAHYCGGDWPTIAEAIEGFTGLDRRMQRLGERPIDASSGGGEATIIDDYGHHPTEIDATLRALRSHYQPERLICVFQPHQHSRTRFLMQQFAVSFAAADLVFVPDIYFVRDSEDERAAVTAADLVEQVRAKGVDAHHVDPLDAIIERLESELRGGDLLVTMGAGDVWRVSHALVNQTPAAV